MTDLFPYSLTQSLHLLLVQHLQAFWPCLYGTIIMVLRQTSAMKSDGSKDVWNTNVTR